MQTDDIVSGWLKGSDSVEGMNNPAGPLHIEGAAATEAAMTDPTVAKHPMCSVWTDTTLKC